MQHVAAGALDQGCPPGDSCGRRTLSMTTICLGLYVGSILLLAIGLTALGAVAPLSTMAESHAAGA